MSDHEIEYEDEELLEEIPETPEEKQLRSLDEFFGELNSGVRLLIQRIEPSWCRGVLEEIEIGNDPLDIDYFIDTWGGKLLSVKIRKKNGTLGGVHPIPLYSYPPMVRGERIYERERNPIQKHEKESPASPSVVVNPSNSLDKLIQALPALLPVATSWFQAAEARRQSDRDLMMQMIARSQRSSGLSDITQLGSVMSQLSEVFKANFTKSDPNDFSAFMPQALDILQKVLSKPEMKSPKSHRITGTKPVPEPTMRPVTSITTTNQDDLARKLASLPPEAGAAKLIEALGMMPPDKRDQVWSTFLSQYEDVMDEPEDDIEEEETDLRGAK